MHHALPGLQVWGVKPNARLFGQLKKGNFIAQNYTKIRLLFAVVCPSGPCFIQGLSDTSMGYNKRTGGGGKRRGWILFY